MNAQSSLQERALVAASEKTLGPRPSRLTSIDLLRGMVVVLMALDHTRDFLSASGQNPRDVTDPALFITRWITHFCAPTFVLLAGVSAYLSSARGGSKRDLSWRLLTRGLWILFVEFTLVSFGWNLTLTGPYIAQVMWVIGASMVILAGLVHLPRSIIATFGVILVAGHNFLDGIRAEDLGSASWLWNLLHEQAALHLSPSVTVIVVYPLLPWPGVMALGYSLGPLFKSDSRSRMSVLLVTGAALIVSFIVLRASNAYGDPTPWTSQATWLGTLLSFVDCEKYPASLLYLMMTLGPALVLLAFFERAHGSIVDLFNTFGRVPFLFYVVHIPLIHLLAVVLAWFTLGEAGWTFGSMIFEKPPGYGMSLAGVYAVWIAVLIVLFPLCRWFADLKRRRKDWWLSYL
jgi:uncharacterized membrane protein